MVHKLEKKSFWNWFQQYKNCIKIWSERVLVRIVRLLHKRFLLNLQIFWRNYFSVIYDIQSTVEKNRFLCKQASVFHWKPIEPQPLNCHYIFSHQSNSHFLSHRQYFLLKDCWQTELPHHEKNKTIPLFLLPITRKKVLSTNDCVHARVLCVISSLDQAMDRIQMKLLRICICISNAALRCAISQDNASSWSL